MNRLLQYSTKRLARFQPALRRIRERAEKRQDAWFKRRESDFKALKKAAFRLRDKATGLIGGWVEIESAAKSSDFEVRAHGGGWAVFEKGGKNGPVQTFAKKSEAVEDGKRRARLRGGHVEVLTKQGSVQSTFTYQPA